MVRSGPSAPATVGLILVAGAAGLAAWLSYSHDPAKQQADLNAQAALADAVLRVDLSKDGRGKQAVTEEAVKTQPKRRDEKTGDEKHGEEEDGDDKPVAKHGKAAPSKIPVHEPAKAATGHAVKPKDSSQQVEEHKLTPKPQPGPQLSLGDHNADRQGGGRARDKAA